MTHPRHGVESEDLRRAKIQTEDGTILRAYLHSPGPGAHPGIVMCPGFGGVKPHIDPYAALFAEAGFAVLNFDNRGWGTSEGEPRQELNVFKQITDLRDAITFARITTGVRLRTRIWRVGVEFLGRTGDRHRRQ